MMGILAVIEGELHDWILQAVIRGIPLVHWLRDVNKSGVLKDYMGEEYKLSKKKGIKQLYRLLFTSNHHQQLVNKKKKKGQIIGYLS